MSLLEPSRVATRTAPLASVRKSFIARAGLQPLVVLRFPLTFTFCLPLSTGPLFSTTTVFFFLPASAVAPKRPTQRTAAENRTIMRLKFMRGD